MAKKKTVTDELHLTLDPGHFESKAILVGMYSASFPSAVVELTEAEWDNAVDGAFGNDDFIKVNGTPFVVGMSAYQQASGRRHRGSRYVKGYVDVLLGAALDRLLKDEGRYNVALSISHPANDKRWVPDLISAVSGKHILETCSGKREVTVTSVHAFPEPIGGFTNLTMDDDLEIDVDLATNRRILVIDSGGVTTHIVAIERGLRISIAKQIEIGAMDALGRFEQMFLAKNSQIFKNGIDQGQLREALRNEEWTAGRPIDCSKEAQQAKANLLAAIAEAIEREVRGAHQFDTVVLTGGGSGLLGPSLITMLDHNDVRPADDYDTIQFANVKGGRKSYLLMKQNELL